MKEPFIDYTDDNEPAIKNLIDNELSQEQLL